MVWQSIIVRIIGFTILLAFRHGTDTGHYKEYGQKDYNWCKKSEQSMPFYPKVEFVNFVVHGLVITNLGCSKRQTL